MKKSVIFVSAVVSVVMAASLTGCGSSSVNKKEVAEEANAIIEEITSLNTKKMQKRDAYDEDNLDVLKTFKTYRDFTIVWDHAEIEVDEESVESKKGKITCAATVVVPDYNSASDDFWDEYSTSDFDDINECYDAFEEFVNEIKLKKYMSIDTTVELEKDGEEYILVNGDDLVEDLMGDYIDQYAEERKEAEQQQSRIKEHNDAINTVTAEIDNILG